MSILRRLAGLCCKDMHSAKGPFLLPKGSRGQPRRLGCKDNKLPSLSTITTCIFLRLLLITSPSPSSLSRIAIIQSSSGCIVAFGRGGRAGLLQAVDRGSACSAGFRLWGALEDQGVAMVRTRASFLGPPTAVHHNWMPKFYIGWLRASTKASDLRFLLNFKNSSTSNDSAA